LPPRYDPLHDLPGFELGSDFLYYGGTPADTLLPRGRLAGHYGRGDRVLDKALVLPGAALAATWFSALDPNFFAHGRYIKNDSPDGSLLLRRDCLSRPD